MRTQSAFRLFPTVCTILLGIVVFSFVGLVVYGLVQGEQHEKRNGEYRWIDHR
jgi:hypothetical protein